jgi:hypothetical protein
VIGWLLRRSITEQTASRRWCSQKNILRIFWNRNQKNIKNTDEGDLAGSIILLGMFFLVIAKLKFIAVFGYRRIVTRIAKINFIAKEHSENILEQEPKKQ